MSDGAFYDLLIAGIAAVTLIFIIMLIITRSVVAAAVRTTTCCWCPASRKNCPGD